MSDSKSIKKTFHNNITKFSCPPRIVELCRNNEIMQLNAHILTMKC